MYLNKFDPIKGIETSLPSYSDLSIQDHLNKFDPIKGIETIFNYFHIFEIEDRI